MRGWGRHATWILAILLPLLEWPGMALAAADVAAGGHVRISPSLREIDGWG